MRLEVKDCLFCNLELETTQHVIMSNELWMFLQLDQAQEKGVPLEAAGISVPKKHRESACDLTLDESNATYAPLQDLKKYTDQRYQPQAYNLGWTCAVLGGHHIFHSHFHVLPRYVDERFRGKGIRYMFKSADNQRGST